MSSKAPGGWACRRHSFEATARRIVAIWELGLACRSTLRLDGCCAHVWNSEWLHWPTLVLGYLTPLPRVHVAWRVWRHWARVREPALDLGYWTSPSRVPSPPVWRYWAWVMWSVELQLPGWRTLCDSGMESAEHAWCRLWRKEFERGLLNKLHTHIPSLAPSPCTYVATRRHIV